MAVLLRAPLTLLFYDSVALSVTNKDSNVHIAFVNKFAKSSVNETCKASLEFFLMLFNMASKSLKQLLTKKRIEIKVRP